MAPTAPAVRPFLGPDVLAFAAQQGVMDLLQPVLDMTQRVFPEARHIDTILEYDPEMPGDRHIVVEVHIGPLAVSRSVERHWQWSRDLFRCCPSPSVCLFGLHVNVGEV